MRLTGLSVAVTGASGFCGAAVATAAAARGAGVICLARRPGPAGRHVRWDAARETPDLTGADVVIHLAAAVGDPGLRPAAEREFRAVNVDGAERLLAAANGRPVVWASSASVYDPRVSRRRVREDHPMAGQLNAYGRSKAAGDRLAQAYGAVVLRPHAVYGPGDPHLLPRLRRGVRGGVPPLPGPDVRTSLTAVENLADACLAALSWPAGPTTSRTRRITRGTRRSPGCSRRRRSRADRPCAGVAGQRGRDTVRRRPAGARCGARPVQGSGPGLAPPAGAGDYLAALR